MTVVDREKLSKQLKALLDAPIDWPKLKRPEDESDLVCELQPTTLRQALMVGHYDVPLETYYNNFHPAFMRKELATRERDEAIEEARLLAGDVDTNALDAFWNGKYPAREELDRKMDRLKKAPQGTGYTNNSVVGEIDRVVAEKAALPPRRHAMILALKNLPLEDGAKEELAKAIFYEEEIDRINKAVFACRQVGMQLGKMEEFLERGMLGVQLEQKLESLSNAVISLRETSIKASDEIGYGGSWRQADQEEFNQNPTLRAIIDASQQEHEILSQLADNIEKIIRGCTGPTRAQS